MKSVGIICEYNPFHNGHIYHLQKVKEKFPDATIILVLASYFHERGEASVLTKWDKTTLALQYGVDLVVELPFAFATQSADIFARGAIQILHHLQVEAVFFGSETNDIRLFEECADIQKNNLEYQLLVKKLMDEGFNYPTAMSKALMKVKNIHITKPNDLLALSYIKEIKRLHSSIKPFSLLRTNDYHVLSNSSITSASSIRSLLKDGQKIDSYIPKEEISLITPIFMDDFFPFLKYKILTSKNLNIYQTVDEGLHSRTVQSIKDAKSLEEFIQKLKTKRYTYNRLMRMCLHILCDFTKEEASLMKDITYIRVLGFNENGKHYLKNHKDKSIPMIYHLTDKNPMMSLEVRATTVYSLIYSKENLVSMEYKKRPIDLSTKSKKNNME